MAVRHGTEGNARDVLEQRKKWLNSITVGRREAEQMEADAALAGAPSDRAAAPVRLPDIEEQYRRPQTDSLMTPGGVLTPAHALLKEYPTNAGGGVGLPGKHGGRGRATRMADVGGGEMGPWTVGMETPANSATIHAPLSAR